MKSIEYRIMNTNDIEDALDFLGNIPGVHLHENGEDSVAGICSYMKRNPMLSYLALVDTKIIGVIFCGHDGRRGFINHLAVSPDFRHQGVASKLLKLVEESLIDLGIKKGALFVLNENDSAMRFYESNGWSEETIVKIYSKILT